MNTIKIKRMKLGINLSFFIRKMITIKIRKINFSTFEWYLRDKDSQHFLVFVDPVFVLFQVPVIDEVKDEFVSEHHISEQSS